MFIRPSHMLVAAMAVIAAPAFAQDSTAEAPTNEITSPLAAGADAAASEAKKAGEAASNAVSNAADSVDAATKDAAAALKKAMPAEEQAPADAATSEGKTAAPEAEASPAPAAAAEGETTPAANADKSTAEKGADSAAAESGEPKPGQYYAKSEHEDWTIRCIKADKGVDPCELYQLMKDEQGNSVAEVTLIPLSNGDVAAGATVVAPLETDLIKGLSLSIDGGEARGYPFSFCAPVGCVSRMGFTAAELNALKRGGRAEIGLLPFGADPSKPVALKLSLSGFTAAFDELSKMVKEAREAATPAKTEAPAE